MNDYRLIKRSNTLLRSLFVYKGSDHLLLVEQYFFLQYCNRLFFSEIKGIVAAKTNHFYYYTMIPLMLFIMFIAVYFYTHSNVIPMFALVFLIISIVNGIYGKTCKICIITGVQEKKLSGIFRWRQWLKIKKTVVPLIEEEQGKLPSDDMSVMEVSPEMKNSSS
jgi:hypothetical protein